MQTNERTQTIRPNHKAAQHEVPRGNENTSYSQKALARAEGLRRRIEMRRRARNGETVPRKKLSPLTQKDDAAGSLARNRQALDDLAANLKKHGRSEQFLELRALVETNLRNAESRVAENE